MCRKFDLKDFKRAALSPSRLLMDFRYIDSLFLFIMKDGGVVSLCRAIQFIISFQCILREI